MTTRYDGGGTPPSTSNTVGGVTTWFLPLVANLSGNNGHVFDCTGSIGLIFENVGITGSATTGFFQARNTSLSTVGISRFTNCTVWGNFAVACYYNFGAEDDQIVGGYWHNTYTGGASKVLSYTLNNISGCTSYQSLPTNARSCIDHRVFGGEFYNQSSNASADVVSIESCDSVKIYGSWMYCANQNAAGNGRALVYVDLTHGASNLCTLHGITGEQGSYQQNYGVLFGYSGTATSALTCQNWDIDSCRFPNQTYPIATVTGTYAPTLSDFHIRNIFDPQSHGFYIPGTLAGSTIDESAIWINLNIVQNCNFTVDTSRVAAAASNIANLAITEAGSANRSWIPTITGVSGLTSSSYKCCFVGQQFTFNIVWSSTGVLSCSAGATVTMNMASSGGFGLAAKCITPSPIPVVNATAGTLIGYGSVTGTTLTLPAISVGAGIQVLIAGSYYVS